MLFSQDLPFLMSVQRDVSVHRRISGHQACCRDLLLARRRSPPYRCFRRNDNALLVHDRVLLLGVCSLGRLRSLCLVFVMATYIPHLASRLINPGVLPFGLRSCVPRCAAALGRIIRCGSCKRSGRRLLPLGLDRDGSSDGGASLLHPQKGEEAGSGRALFAIPSRVGPRMVPVGASLPFRAPPNPALQRTRRKRRAAELLR